MNYCKTIDEVYPFAIITLSQDNTFGTISVIKNSILFNKNHLNDFGDSFEVGYSENFEIDYGYYGTIVGINITPINFKYDRLLLFNFELCKAIDNKDHANAKKILSEIYTDDVIKSNFLRKNGSVKLELKWFPHNTKLKIDFVNGREIIKPLNSIN